MLYTNIKCLSRRNNDNSFGDSIYAIKYDGTVVDLNYCSYTKLSTNIQLKITDIFECDGTYIIRDFYGNLFIANSSIGLIQTLRFDGNTVYVNEIKIKIKSARLTVNI